MHFVVHDVNDESVTFGRKYKTGRGASKHAKKLNEGWKREGVERRVRVAKKTDEEPITHCLIGTATPTWLWEVKHAKPAFRRSPYRCMELAGSGYTWRARELYRHGIDKLPWRYESWYFNSDAWGLHFAHPSELKPGYVAFTPSEEHGIADRQLRMRPGTYLNRFFGDVLSSDSIQYWAHEWEQLFAPLELQFAKTADEIENVYVFGPESCMSHSAGHFQNSVHPVRAYAGPDLQVAYLEHDDSVVARAVVWPEKKLFTVVYGDFIRLKNALKAEGYQPGCLENARLSQIPTEDGLGYHVPYVDKPQRFNVGREWLVLSSDGEFVAETTSGVVMCRCVSCATLLKSGSRESPSEDGTLFCVACFEKEFDICGRCGKRHRYTEMTSVGHNEVSWCAYCVEHYSTTCSTCEVRVPDTRTTAGVCMQCQEA